MVKVRLVNQVEFANLIVINILASVSNARMPWRLRRCYGRSTQGPRFTEQYMAKSLSIACKIRIGLPNPFYELEMVDGVAT